MTSPDVKSKWRLKTIEAKMSAILALLLSIVMISFMAYNYHRMKSERGAELQHLAQIVSKRLAANLIVPMWDLNNKLAGEAVAAEMLAREVFAAVVTEADSPAIFTAKKRGENWDIVDTKGDITGEFIVYREDVHRQDDKLGTLELYVTRRFLEEELSRNLRREILAVVILNIVLIVGLYLIAKHTVVQPLNRIVDSMDTGANQVAVASAEVASASQTLASGTSQQSASVEAISASLEEISSMTRQNADNTNQADALMKQTGSIVTESDVSMSDLKKLMKKISQASEETSKIIKTIDEISFKTNLLALNAAVEAARAGEAGAGFAVVAEEVRNLAMHAAEAAGNTTTLIETSMKLISRGNDAVLKVDQAFVKVADSTNTMGELVGEISVASTEQSRGIEKVNASVYEMDKTIQENAATTEEAASASEEMSAQAETLKVLAKKLALITGRRKGSEDMVMDGDTVGRIQTVAKKTGERSRQGNYRQRLDNNKYQEVCPDKLIPLGEDEFIKI